MPPGGKRKGAGRKPGPMGKKQTKSHALTPDVMDYLATVENQSELVDSLVRKSSGFKKWAAIHRKGK